MVNLKEHLEKYPEMQIEDIIKLHLQGIMGNGHLVKDKQIALDYMLREYESIEGDSSPMIEEISDRYVRVYLYPYFQKHQSFEALAEDLVKTARQGDLILIMGAGDIENLFSFLPLK